MQFLVQTARAATADPAVVSEGLASEIERVCRLYQDGLVRQIWHRADRPGAILLLEAPGETDVVTALATLPLVAAGAVEVESIVELRPYAGFAPTS